MAVARTVRAVVPSRLEPVETTPIRPSIRVRVYYDRNYEHIERVDRRDAVNPSELFRGIENRGPVRDHGAVPELRLGWESALGASCAQCTERRHNRFFGI